MTASDDTRVGDLTVEQLEGVLWARRTREQAPGPVWLEEEQQLREQARVCKVGHDMIVEDGFPAALVTQVLIAERPRHAAAIAQAVEEAVAESLRSAS